MNLTRNREVVGSIPGLAPQWVKDLGIAVSCGVGGCRCGSDPVLLWLWHRPAAMALNRPLAWESPHAASAALKKKKKRKYSLCFHFLEEIVEKWYHFFLKCLVEFTSESFWACSFLFWKVIIDSNYLIGAIQVIYFSLFELW